MQLQINVSKGTVARVYFFTQALAEFQHVSTNVSTDLGVACYARAETFTEAVASMVDQGRSYHRGN